MATDRKYAASMKVYPGLIAETDVEFPSAGICVVPTAGVPHHVAITNNSLLTFEVAGDSSCGTYYLRYVCDQQHAHHGDCPTINGEKWPIRFSALFRLDSQPRTSTRSANLASRAGSGAAKDQEVVVELTFTSEPYAPVGPVNLILQLDTDGNQ